MDRSGPAPLRWLSHTPMILGTQVSRVSTRTNSTGWPLSGPLPAFNSVFMRSADRANQIGLNAFGAAEQVAVPPDTTPAGKPGASSGSLTVVAPPLTVPYDPRFRIEHAQVLLPEDFNRFATEHVIASMQPSHLLTDMKWAAARLGPERSIYAYAWKSFLDHGVTLALGTDYPVESINPFRGLYAAVTRKNEAGTMTFHPEQALTLDQALYAYTQGSAYADFSEKVRGRLESGYAADFIVLDRDITKVGPREILATRVIKTIVGGEVVFDAANTRSTR